MVPSRLISSNGSWPRYRNWGAAFLFLGVSYTGSTEYGDPAIERPGGLVGALELHRFPTGSNRYKIDLVSTKSLATLYRQLGLSSHLALPVFSGECFPRTCSGVEDRPAGSF